MIVVAPLSTEGASPTRPLARLTRHCTAELLTRHCNSQSAAYAGPPRTVLHAAPGAYRPSMRRAQAARG
eukprot:6203904-Pleurochrysis_carterae.AAC.1